MNVGYMTENYNVCGYRGSCVSSSPYVIDYTFVKSQQPGCKQVGRRNTFDNTLFNQQKAKRAEDMGVKRVRFDDNAKTWDGLSADHERFDFLLFVFLLKGASVGDIDVFRWTKGDFDTIKALVLLLHGLLKRVVLLEENELTPVLPNGGGRTLKVSRKHFKFLEQLYKVLIAALKLAAKAKKQQLL
eukprot:snap_masked-scaffold_11-processed-gene-7.30-mRNA-1 protein AED:0.18 eAED:1.00 QI:0/-1/0/1/-1/1/1/0/185